MIVQPGHAGGHQADLRRGVTHEWRGKWEPVEQSPDAQRDSGTEVQDKRKENARLCLQVVMLVQTGQERKQGKTSGRRQV